MLARINRLSKQKDFEAVFKNGGWQQNKYLAVRFMQNGQLASRSAVVVSAKVTKKAVLRNKIRRQITETLAQSWSDIKKGQDLVWVAKNQIITLEPSAIRQVVQELLRRAKLYVR